MAPQIGENSAITLESRNYDYRGLRKHALCDAAENHLIKRSTCVTYTVNDAAAIRDYVQIDEEKVRILQSKSVLFTIGYHDWDLRLQ